MKVLKINSVTSDGRKADETPILFHPVDPDTGKPFVDDQGAPTVEIVLRPLTREIERQFERQFTEPAMVMGVTSERTDREAVRDAEVCYVVTSWTGFVGADNKPLPCLEIAKRALDWAMKNAIIAKATLAQPVEVPAASFREPPAVV